MPALTFAERSLAGSIAAHESWANTTNRSARTAPARAALDAKFLDAADGDPIRAAHLRKAHFARLALKSAQSRRKAKEFGEGAATAEAELDALGGELDGAGGSSPPGGTAVTQPHPRANGENPQGESSAFLSTKLLTREAAKVVDDLALPITPARIRLLVKRFVNEGRSDIDFRTWFISYFDPTGETAVRNVMGGGNDAA